MHIIVFPPQKSLCFMYFFVSRNTVLLILTTKGSQISLPAPPASFKWNITMGTREVEILTAIRGFLRSLLISSHKLLEYDLEYSK